jgi:hypothetical protein
MEYSERFQSKTIGSAKPKKDTVVRLDSAAQELIDNQILPQQTIFDSVNKLWEQLLPNELAQHCRISDITGGHLKVIVDSPSYMHELRLCSIELLKELQQRCSRARIKKIKLILA